MKKYIFEAENNTNKHLTKFSMLQNLFAIYQHLLHYDNQRDFHEHYNMIDIILFVYLMRP